MEYNFSKIEQDWKKYWKENNVYKVSNDSDKPKYYILDMFPYPSGAGLHVGHPLGYIASDIYARYKRLSGYNVLHPMGYDAFGLPAEQYALETGQHPAVTTEKNIARYREQLDNIGFCYDWSREVRTSDPKYYKWTQWIFLQLFHSWFDRKENKARSVSTLIEIFEKEGNAHIPSPGNEELHFDAPAWMGFSEKEKRDALMSYRLAYQGYAVVWWCEALGTVLANDEVVNGVSERGGHPVERKQMRQWFLRITEYAERLLGGLDTLDWSEAMKEMQRNWIGKSNGAEVDFKLANDKGEIKVFTTRPDTIFGVDFMVLAPEHELVDSITTAEQQHAIDEYRQYVKSRSERERMSEVKQVTGCFTGAYAIHPFTKKEIPVWIAEYVLAGYGTGAIMAVPSGDDRDHAFAKHFDIPITNIFGDKYNGEEAYSDKGGRIAEQSDFLNGMDVAQAIDTAIDALVKIGVGKKKVNYKLRDAGFSRQRYWGEPFPIIYVDGVPYANDEEIFNAYPQLQQLPVELPHVDNYKPGPEGQGPLANIPAWVNTPLGQRETNTMPGYAGSSWYFLRYMDPHNDETFAGKKATDYWREVDLYIGGTEHAVGHLLYSRMWTKALHDLGHISFDEPFKKLVNQGMIQGSTRFVYRKTGTNIFISAGLKEKDPVDEIRVDVNIVDGLELDMEAFKKWRPEYADAEFILEDDKYICGAEVEKMSKSKYNVVNPDDIVAQYGADTFRMYEMFLGPIEMSKPWDTKGIEGVHRFLKKMWRLYFDEQKGWIVTDETATEAELRTLHKTIKKITDDIERFSFNTCVSQFMICVNELSSLNCHKREVLEKLAVLICPFAPHFAEELWHRFGHDSSVVAAGFPRHEQKYVTENSKKYPVAVNGKTRVELEFPLDMEQASIEQEVLADPTIIKWLEGKTPKKVIYVKGKMINVVV
ncbi:MAG: leucine--tRNA ligase [Bacteroidetes bacterium 46-16]|nr:MAG: leucine--tRNA ligase [Bacteroidetes bacterium 46-16]